jgi:cytochrome c peroxidase
MNRLVLGTLTFIVGVWWLISCKNDPPRRPIEQSLFRQPASFGQPLYNFSQNPVTKEGFELGRKLFYDPILSVDSSLSCGDCHKQFSGFSDFDHRVSHGVFYRFGTRNTPSLANLAWMSEFAWDGGVNHLESFPILPITKDFEMGNTLPNLINSIKQHQEYPQLFKAAFGTDTITTQRIFRVLAQFLTCLVSDNSKYDQFTRGKASFSTIELEGLQLFRNKCGNCHPEPLFTDLSYRNKGIEAVATDSGRALLTGETADIGKFKVPGLRNVAISQPYMHDGKIETLRQVLDFMSSGMHAPPQLDPSLIQNGRAGIPLTEAEKDRIEAFLKTLTDNEYINDPKFKNPF